MLENRIAKKVKINGIVQGVGFRPFVYQLANRYNIKGEVANTSSGVLIHAEGTPRDMDFFLKDVHETPPPLAQISEITVANDILSQCERFVISKSEKHSSNATLISPDIATCPDCLAETFDPEDRRFGYPFTNCTHCGPRYTIIRDVPYDRPNTSMDPFRMCEACRREYDDPLNRRFHAQPNACGKCGPRVYLYDREEKLVETENPIAETATLLKRGFIVAIKGLGGFHLAADAENHDAVSTLRRRKNREEKPLAVMAFDLDTVRKFTKVSSEEEAYLTSNRRPIVLMKKKPGDTLPEAIAPKNKTIGVMLPYTPLHYLLLAEGFTALVMTSANFSEEPIIIDNTDAFRRLGGIADYFLIHHRDILTRCDDSVLKVIDRKPVFVRRSRGYAPAPIFLKCQTGPEILACGAELKNTICLTKEGKAFPSQHIGDLENPKAHDFYTETVDYLTRILDITPEVVAYDLHPEYFSTYYAEKTSLLKIPVQHHHAHIASCMAENHLYGPVIGLAFDGTGYGTDGAIWGGEVLIVDYDRFERAGCLKYVPMPGADAAVKAPWRMAVSYLYDAFGEEIWDLDLVFLKTLDKNNLKIIIEMIRKGLNSPYTSSMGRLFDGVAAVLGLRHRVSYEGQAAMELESSAMEETEGRYPMQWDSATMITVDFQPMWKAVVADIMREASIPMISTKFHNTLSYTFAEICRDIRKRTSLDRVALSGGVFQNAIFLKKLIKMLERNSFQVYTQSAVPVNDGGISLGQAAVAASLVNGKPVKIEIQPSRETPI